MYNILTRIKISLVHSHTDKNIEYFTYKIGPPQEVREQIDISSIIKSFNVV